MDCRTAEGMVNGYIERTLSNKELEQFLKHIESCTSCYEELETYYIVHEATRQLAEEDAFVNFDMKGLLKEDLIKTRKRIERNRFFKAVSYLLTGTAFVSFVLYFIYVIIGLI